MDKERENEEKKMSVISNRCITNKQRKVSTTCYYFFHTFYFRIDISLTPSKVQKLRRVMIDIKYLNVNCTYLDLHSFR